MNNEIDNFIDINFSNDYANVLKSTLKDENISGLIFIKKAVEVIKYGDQFKANSKKLSNIFSINQPVLLASLSSLGLLLFVDKAVAFFLALLNLIANTYKNMDIEFSEREAKVLFVIYKLKRKLSLDSIYGKYIEMFGEYDKGQILRSLIQLKDLQVLKKTDQFKYELIEDIKIKYR